MGASPTPPVRLVQDADRESPADRAAAYNTSLDEAVRRLPAGPLRAAVRRLLDEARIAPAKWEGWADRILGWEQGLGTSRMREVPREAIVLGLEELLLSNQPGQFITPQIALIFAEKARARMSEGEGPSGAGRGAHPPRTSGPTAKESQLRDAIEYARNGDEAARAWCTENAVDWEVAS
ncbi:hypothetical protein GAU_2236 [Gemmatimonas aurantiaca T-27]|uniref:Uncharacterized protein n=1 Tax=Gemmatimonas aurantiaca (strain DSM 14586 / JCM 11422 / NBRC 100505 / T-27) TaxID=379066 RepID=C1A9V1_GEMAT|nr:hypothetical protein [Gemmatimonas aurantiaca]BAH39278.1 hypothetical protein GAU_2236 [Gemmatimonas aurantiaca T-27]